MTKLPYPNIKPNANVILEASVGLTNNGSETFAQWSGDAIFTEHHKWVQTAEGKKVKGAGKIFLFHDIFPSLAELTGFATVRGVKHTFSGSRFYNPDGTVHHVELELM